MSASRAENTRNAWARLTPEQREARRRHMSEGHKAAIAKLTPQERQERAEHIRTMISASMTPESLRRRSEGQKRAWARRKAAAALLDGAREIAEAAVLATDAVECDVQPMVEVPRWTPPKPTIAPVPALIVKGAGTSLMARAAAILEAGLAAAQQAIAVQLETADGALHVAELALAFVRADAKSRGTFDAFAELRRAALAWDEARGGGR